MNPVFAKVLIHEIGPVSTAWARYFGAFIAYLAYRFVLGCSRRLRGKQSGLLPETFMWPDSWDEAVNVALIGLTTCFFSPLTQMIGLSSSTAVNNAILVALEPVFTVLFSALFLRERLTRLHLISFAVALLGFSLLSKLVSPSLWSKGGWDGSMGDAIIAAAVAGEAMYSVFGKKLLGRHSESAIFGTALAVGAVCLSAVQLAWQGLPPIGELTWKGWLAVLWIGPLGTSVTYLYWLQALRRGVPIGSMALTLFVQPLVGALAGVFFLNEPLSILQVMGGMLIFAAVGAQWGRAAARERQPGIATDAG